jgi:hypothetical protein
MKMVSIEPNWPNLLRFYEKVIRETPDKAKRAEFEEAAEEIRAYLRAKEEGHAQG